MPNTIHMECFFAIAESCATSGPSMSSAHSASPHMNSSGSSATSTPSLPAASSFVSASCSELLTLAAGTQHCSPAIEATLILDFFGSASGAGGSV